MTKIFYLINHRGEISQLVIPSYLWGGSKLPALRPHGRAHCAIVN